MPINLIPTENKISCLVPIVNVHMASCQRHCNVMFTLKIRWLTGSNYGHAQSDHCSQLYRCCSLHVCSHFSDGFLLNSYIWKDQFWQTFVHGSFIHNIKHICLHETSLNVSFGFHNTKQITLGNKTQLIRKCLYSSNILLFFSQGKCNFQINTSDWNFQLQADSQPPKCDSEFSKFYIS